MYDCSEQIELKSAYIVNKKYQQGMITFKDIQKSSTYPNASKDSNGSLIVGAAVSTSS